MRLIRGYGVSRHHLKRRGVVLHENQYIARLKRENGREDIPAAGLHGLCNKWDWLRVGK